MSYKKLLLVRSETLGLFVKILSADNKYSGHNKDNFPQQIEMIFSQKPEILSGFFIAFLNSTSNFQYFQKTMSLIV